MLKEFTEWLIKLLRETLEASWDLLKDLLIEVFSLITDAFVAIVTAIPVPQWMSGGLGDSWGALDSGVMFIATQSGVPAALGILGAGYGFRLLRKFFTLFQW